jgi:hypothetical protein
MQIELKRIWREGNSFKAEDQAGIVYDVEALNWHQDTIAVTNQKGTTYLPADARWHVTVGGTTFTVPHSTFDFGEDTLSD